MSPQARLVVEPGIVACGGVFHGTVSWTGNQKHHRVAVVLRYRTSGRGDIDSAVVSQWDLGLSEGGETQFRLDVPPTGPVTYNGQLLRLQWEAAVKVAKPRALIGSGADLAIVDLAVVPHGWPPPDPQGTPDSPESLPPWGSPEDPGRSG